MCDNKFHTQALSELLNDDQRFGFVVMDGNGSLYGTICGNTCVVTQRDGRAGRGARARR